MPGALTLTPKVDSFESHQFYDFNSGAVEFTWDAKKIYVDFDILKCHA